MSASYEEAAKRAEIEGFTVEMRLDATVRVGEWDFVKPGASSSVKFSTIPEEEQLRVSMKFMTDEVIVPTLEEVLVQVQQQLRKARGGA